MRHGRKGVVLRPIKSRPRAPMRTGAVCAENRREQGGNQYSFTATQPLAIPTTAGPTTMARLCAHDR